MSTIDQQQPDAAQPEEVSPAMEKVRRRGQWWIIGTLATLIITIWASPTIVAHTPLRNRLLRSVFSELNGTISSRTASMGWFSKTRLYDVEIRDPQGKLLLEAPLVEGDKSAGGLLANSEAAGRFEMLKPRVHVTLTDKGSNVEEVFAAWIKADESKSACPALELKVSDATVLVHNAETNEQWQLEQVESTLALAHNWSKPMTLALTATSPQPDRKCGLKLSLTVDRSPAADGKPKSSGAAELETDALPLAMLEPLARRLEPEAELSGWLSSKATCQWGHDAAHPDAAVLDAEINAEGLRLAAPQLGNDVLQLDRLIAPCRLTYEPHQVRIEQLSVDCEVGQAALDGPVTIDLDREPGAAAMTALLEENYQINGRLDLAKLAQILPGTLRIREGTDITAGNVSLSMGRRGDAENAAWQGKIEMSNLSALSAGRRYTWQKPVKLTFAARDGKDGPVVDRIFCESDFLELEAAGTLDYMSVSASYNLEQLRQEMGRFIDLGAWKLGGDGWAYVTWKRSASGKVEADGEFQVRNLAVDQPGGAAWAEENLVLLLSLTGRTSGDQLERIDTATLDLASGGDQAKIRLTKAVTNLTAEGTAWPVRAQVQGELPSWLSRLAPWVGPMAGWNVTGQGRLDAHLACQRDVVEMERVSFGIKNLHAAGYGLTVNEPTVKLDLAGRWQPKLHEVQIHQANLTAAAAALEGRQLVWTLPSAAEDDSLLDGEPRKVGAKHHLSGAIHYSGDLARLQQWGLAAGDRPNWRMAGGIRGQVNFEQTPKSIGAELTSIIENLVATPRQGKAWQERLIQVTANGTYDPARDMLSIKRIKVDSDMLRADAKGRILELAAERDLELDGRMDYDTLRLVEIMRPYIGEGVEIVARRDARPFSIRARLAGAALVGNNPALKPVSKQTAETPWLTVKSSIGWTGANIYGFQVASGEIQGTLLDGLLRVSPMKLVVSDGKLTAAPQVRFWPGAGEIYVPSGNVLKNVRISPEMCERGLKYAAPVLAGATQAEGRFSMALDNCLLPLNNPGAGDAAGRLTVHSVQISAGPMLRELVVMSDTVRRLATGRPARQEGSTSSVNLTRESVVSFRMAEGRVYHRDLELEFDDVVVRTQGSVGLDQTLSMMVEMPVPAKWIGSSPASLALRNQTLRLPLGGTLAQPKIDRQALERLGVQYLRTSAQDIFLNGLNKQLDKVMAPRR